MRDTIASKWPEISQSWSLRHSIGIDTGKALLTRTGIRGSNDIVSIGAAPNVAAKLSDLGTDGYAIHITQAVYDAMHNKVAFADYPAERVPMWAYGRNVPVGGRSITVMHSNYWMEPS